MDTETTGLNSKKDHLIELGIVIIEYCPETGQLYRVCETYNALEDPGIPIPNEAIKIHGITNEMVSGKKMNDSEVEALLLDVGLIIAHNAAFDRAFFEARFPSLSKKAWACSVAQIPWKNEGLSAANLAYLAYRFGFHFSAHRASDDCFALLEILHGKLPESGTNVFKMLLENARITDIKLWALKADINHRHQLKERGYKWDGSHWNITVLREDREKEIDWLLSDIYQNNSFQIKQETINAYNRFSSDSTAEVVTFDSVYIE